MNSYNRAELTQALFDESGDALFLFDPDTENLCEVNPTAERLTAFPRRELLRTQITYLFRSEVKGGLERLRQAFRRTGLFHSQEGFLLRRMDGRWVPVNLTIARLHLKPKPLGLITARDIGEHREAHARLKQAEERLRTVVSNAPVVLFSVDAKGIFTLFEGQGLQALGLRPAEVVGRSIFEVYRQAPRILENIRRVLAGEDFTAIVEVDGGPGAGCWFQIHYAPIRDRHGQVSGAIGVAADITEGQRVAAALRRSRQDHEALVDSIDGIVWEADPRTFSFTFVSNFAERLLGYPVSRWTTEPYFWKDHIHPEDRERVVGLCVAATAAGESHTMEYRLLAADGSVVWLRDLVTVVVQDGQPTRLRGIMVDITERKRLEEAIHQAEAKYRGIFEHTVEGIYQTAADGRFLTGNPALVRIFGFRSTQEMLTPGRDYYAEPGRRAEFRERIAREGHVTDFESEIICPDGRRIWISENARELRGTDGVATGYEGTVTDITARKQAEQALRQSEARYRCLIENLEQNITLKDTQFRVVASNKAFCDGLGLPESEIVGKTDFDLYPRHLAEKYRADDLIVLTEGRRLEVEEENVGENKLRAVRVIKTPVRDAEGRVTGILIIFWDITKQRTLEEQLRQAHKMEAIGQLAGGVAHDFNNLLTVILGNVSMQIANLPPGMPGRELLAAAEQAALRGADLTRQLLGFSRKTTLRPQPTDLNRIGAEAVALLRRIIDPRIRIEIKAVPDLWAAHTDPGQMNQILMNLCLNARDAMPEGGRLLLELENLVLDEEYTRLHLGTRAGEFVRLRVCDTGHGMPPEVRARIFEPFFTTKGVGKGTGLGLAMVYGIVKQHDGWIGCYSEVGKGTCFDIYLPRSRQDTGATALTSQTPAPCAGTETILLVDDEPMIRNLGRAILENYGYQVLEAEDGVEAVEVYRREMGRIALVILDRTMPRLSGRDALRQLRQIDPEVPVVFSSGYSADQTGSEAGDVHGYVNKPYRPQELGNTVRSVLDRCRHATAAITCESSVAGSACCSELLPGPQSDRAGKTDTTI